MNLHELSAQQKAAYVTDQFNGGAVLTTQDVADMFGMSRQGAYYLLDNVSAVVPLLLHRHKWRRLPRKEFLDINVLD